MNIFKAMDQHRKMRVLIRLLPNGCDTITAKYILYALHYDLSLINTALLEDMTETGLCMCLDRLPFNVYELTEEEKEMLTDYCLSKL